MVRLRKFRLRTALLAAGVCLAVPAAALAVTGTFTGTTSQGNKCGANHSLKCTVFIHIVKNVVKNDSFIDWRAGCKTRNILSGSTSIQGPLKNGKFHGRGTYTVSLNNGTLHSRNTATIDFKISGRSAPGIFSLSGVVYKGKSPTGKNVLDHCNTGRVTFTAKS